MRVVDLDGTLLNVNGYCSKKSKRYLKKFHDLGYIIVIATGRVLKSAIDVTDGAEFANYVIANAGALIYDMNSKKIIMRNSISLNDTKMILSCYSNEVDYINICDLYYHNRCLGNKKIKSIYEKNIQDLNKFISNCEDILHITVKLKNNDLVDKYYNKLKSDSLNIIVMQDSFSKLKWLEIFNNGVSKYNAIKTISEIENIDTDNIIAFGDGLNDIDMIRMCGVGVSMENALDQVKLVSNYSTLSHNEDGVIYFLKKYLQNNN